MRGSRLFSNLVTYGGYCDHVICSLTKLSSQYCKFVDLNGVLKPSFRRASQLEFDYKADALGMKCVCDFIIYSNIFMFTVRLQDCVLNFHKHGMQVHM